MREHSSRVQVCIRFSEADPHELVSNGRQRSFFWRACLPSAAAFQYYSPPLSSSDFKQKIGAFTVSTFVPGTTQALTGTEDGDVVVWDEQGISAEVGTKARDRKAVKIMRLHQQSILWLSTIGDFIATGGADGFVRFFDPMLRLVAWFENMAAGAVCSVSFSAAPATVDSSQLHDLDLFLCPDFVVGTQRGAIVAQTASAFNGTVPAERAGKLIVPGLLTDVTVCCAHPLQPSVLIAAACGGMQVCPFCHHLCFLTSVASQRKLWAGCQVPGHAGVGHNTAHVGDHHRSHKERGSLTNERCVRTLW